MTISGLSFGLLILSTAAFAKILVYSISTDGPVKEPNLDETQSRDANPVQTPGYLAGSKALDTLDRLITSTESFFHPSNSGQWSITVCVSTSALDFGTL